MKQSTFQNFYFLMLNLLFGNLLWDCNVRQQRQTFLNYLAMNTLLQSNIHNIQEKLAKVVPIKS